MKRTIKMIADFRERIEQQEETIEQLDNENRLLKREIKFSEEKLNNAYKRIRDLIPILP
jgi:predicted RNase H-like nuclease (RuvC/YqgF family)|tara:strand:- start:2573 stop:2749 length:177 start_codon:yes stop_codon:yes gene_type:complete